MTIAAGFLTPDGPVICADRQLTYSSGYKKYGKKVFCIRIKDGLILTAYAGFVHIMSKINRELTKRIEQKSCSPDEIQDALEKSIAAGLRKEKRRFLFQTISAIYLKSGERLLLESSDTSVFTPANSRLSVIGCGDDALTHYLTSLMTGVGIPRTTFQAVIWAIYLIKQAKEYIDGCGGPTDVCYVDQKGVLANVYAGYISKVEDDLNELFGANALFLCRILESMQTPEETESAFKDFRKYCVDFAGRHPISQMNPSIIH